MGPVAMVGQIGKQGAGLLRAEVLNDPLALLGPQATEELDSPRGVHTTPPRYVTPTRNRDNLWDDSRLPACVDQAKSGAQEKLGSI